MLYRAPYYSISHHTMPYHHMNLLVARWQMQCHQPLTRTGTIIITIINIIIIITTRLSCIVGW